MIRREKLRKHKVVKIITTMQIWEGKKNTTIGREELDGDGLERA